MSAAPETPPAAGMAWDDGYRLGHGALDATHAEFVRCVDAMLRAVDPVAAMTALDAFAEHAQQHFADEARWMGEEFPARDCHVDEHDKVLASVREVQQAAAAGDIGLVRDLAVALADWFPAHADYMDAALASWLVHRSHGGAPLVLRRNAAARAVPGEEGG